MQLEQIRCADIRSDPRCAGYQPHEIEVLADSIRRHGVLRPVLLRETANGYVLVHGERRWRAAQTVGLDTIPAYLVQDFGPGEGVAVLTATRTSYEMAAIDD
jgi:ParB family transcriptional regulator, chromosome partitioning protein